MIRDKWHSHGENLGVPFKPYWVYLTCFKVKAHYCNLLFSPALASRKCDVPTNESSAQFAIWELKTLDRGISGGHEWMAEFRPAVRKSAEVREGGGGGCLNWPTCSYLCWRRPGKLAHMMLRHIEKKLITLVLTKTQIKGKSVSWRGLQSGHITW